MKKALLLLPALLLLILCCSCVQSMDDLYQLPMSMPEYQELQSEVNKRLSLGWEMAYPTTGELRTTVHFADLTGDGIDESIMLMRSTTSSDLALLVYADDGGSYRLFSEYDLTGSAFSRIAFGDVNGDGASEVLLGIQHGTEALYNAHLLHISPDGVCERLLKVAYTDWFFYDADNDSIDNLLILQNSENSFDATAILYGVEGSGIRELGRAPLSVGVTKPEKIVSGKIEGDYTIAIVESKYYVDGYIADSLLYRGGHFVNLGYDEVLKINTNYLMPILVTAADTDGDGLIELPTPEEVSLADGSSFYRIDWYAPQAAGGETYDCSTYHDLDAGWYVRWDADWRYRMVVSVSNNANGVRRTVFRNDNDEIVMEIKMYPARLSELIPANAETILFTINGSYISVVKPTSDRPAALSVPQIKRIFYIADDAIQFSAVPVDE